MSISEFEQAISRSVELLQNEQQATAAAKEQLSQATTPSAEAEKAREIAYDHCTGIKEGLIDMLPHISALVGVLEGGVAPGKAMEEHAKEAQNLMPTGQAVEDAFGPARTVMAGSKWDHRTVFSGLIHDINQNRMPASHDTQATAECGASYAEGFTTATSELNEVTTAYTTLSEALENLRRKVASIGALHATSATRRYSDVTGDPAVAAEKTDQLGQAFGRAAEVVKAFATDREA